jgi:hypothetical protein
MPQKGFPLQQVDHLKSETGRRICTGIHM